MNFSTPTNYRAQAEKCLELSERAKDRETKFHWLSMAEACFVLAEAQEKEAPIDVGESPLHPSFDQKISPTRH
jgi:hypothetical protein